MQESHDLLMTQGIEEALEGAGAVLLKFHLYTRRNKDPQWGRDGGKAAMDILNGYKPDVVITMDDNAQEYFGKLFVTMKDAPPLVFGGIDPISAKEKYGYPTNKITGVLEVPNISEGIELLQKITPKAKNIVMMTDQSISGNQFFSYAKTIKDHPGNIIAWEQPKTFADFKNVFAKHKNKADAYAIYVMRNVQKSSSDPTPVDEFALMKWVSENVKKPTLGLFDVAAEAGLLCALSVSMKEQGIVAGKIAKEILKGTAPSKIPIAPSDRSRIQLNLKTAAKLGIEVDYNVIRNAEVLIK
jgi:ABC-type uncharacterized transport system substrate-binding protein